MEKENPFLVRVTTGKYHKKSLLFQIRFSNIEYDYSPHNITETHWNLRYKLYCINENLKLRVLPTLKFLVSDSFLNGFIGFLSP